MLVLGAERIWRLHQKFEWRRTADRKSHFTSDGFELAREIEEALDKNQVPQSEQANNRRQEARAAQKNRSA